MCASALFGPVVELAYTSDLKSDAYTGHAGSSPAGATIDAGVTQLAECQPSKLDVVGSRPSTRSKYSGLAQLVEQTAVNRLVAGSSPAAGAILTLKEKNYE